MGDACGGFLGVDEETAEGRILNGLGSWSRRRGEGYQKAYRWW